MYNMKEAYLLHITLLQWSKNLVEVLCVSHVHTTSTAQFRFTYLQMKLRKYVYACDSTDI